MAMGVYSEEYFTSLIEGVLKKKDITAEKISIELGMTTGHHQDVAITIRFPKCEAYKYGRQDSISFRGMPTGCGLAVMAGHAWVYGEVMDDVIEAMCQHYENDGCAIIATIGDDYWNDCPKLKQYGFVPISAYRNMAHPEYNDYQSLWIRSSELRSLDEPKRALRDGDIGYGDNWDDGEDWDDDDDDDWDNDDEDEVNELEAVAEQVVEEVAEVVAPMIAEEVYADDIVFTFESGDYSGTYEEVL